MEVLISFCSKNCKEETLLLILLHIHLAKKQGSLKPLLYKQDNRHWMNTELNVLVAYAKMTFFFFIDRSRRVKTSNYL